MRLQSSTRRRGATLTEVLIAIFVLALGLMGVLSLFVLGMVRMGQSTKDDRCALANHNATTLVRIYWKDQLALVPPLQQTPNLSPNQIRDYFFSAMLDPNAPYMPPLGLGIPAAFQSGTTPAIPFYSSLPSYPVFIDAVGFNNPYNLGTAQQFWVGGVPGTIPRRSLRDVDYYWNTNVNPPRYDPNPYQKLLIDHYFVQMDDVGFGRDGTPTDSSGQNTAYSQNAAQNASTMSFQVQVDGRYNWAFLLRRPTAIQWDIADLSVVVYSGRSTDGPITESLCSANFVPGSTELTLNYQATGVRPNIRKGTWILDTTMSRPLGGGQFTPEPHGFFYRVIAVTAESTGVSVTVELQQTIQDPRTGNAPLPNDTALPHGSNTNWYGVAAVMDNVAEVFDRKTLTSVITPGP